MPSGTTCTWWRRFQFSTPLCLSQCSLDFYLHIQFGFNQASRKSYTFNNCHVESTVLGLHCMQNGYCNYLNSTVQTQEILVFIYLLVNKSNQYIWNIKNNPTQTKSIKPCQAITKVSLTCHIICNNIEDNLLSYDYLCTRMNCQQHYSYQSSNKSDVREAFKKKKK